LIRRREGEDFAAVLETTMADKLVEDGGLEALSNCREVGRVQQASQHVSRRPNGEHTRSGVVRLVHACKIGSDRDVNQLFIC
jgi:hypothetical protein